jgi:serine/threonine-protein kinase
MFGKLSSWPALALCAAGAVLPGRAQAESSASQKAAAESLFDDGVKAMKAGHFADACPKLEESERIDPGIGTLLYLGECYEKTGRTASAWATFREAASTAQAQGEIERARIASSRADRLQAGLSKLAVRIAPETAQLSALRVTRDNAPIAATLFGVAIPVDPGKYHVVASADGYESYEADVEVAGNADSKTLDIPALKVAPKGAAAVGPVATASLGADATTSPTDTTTPATSDTAPAQPAPNSRLRTAAYVTGAIGLVGLGVGSYFGVRAISKNSDAETHCPKGDVCNDADGPRLTSQAKNAAVVSNITIAVGAAFVVAGVVLYLSSEPKREARLELHPILSRDVAGIGFGGAFR